MERCEGKENIPGNAEDSAGYSSALIQRPCASRRSLDHMVLVCKTAAQDDQGRVDIP